MSTVTLTSRRSTILLSSISPWRRTTSPSCKIDIRNLKNHPRFRSTATTEALPRIAQTSLWTSIFPKFIRDRFRARTTTTSDPSSKPVSKEWNPATFYIVIFMLIGSQAIQMLVLRKDFENFNRKADAKIRLLTEVIQRVKNGEKVDVEKLLGTGDETKEREWEEVLREIEEEDSMWHQKSRRKPAPNSSDNKSKESGSINDTKEQPGSRPQQESLNSANMSPNNSVTKGRFY